MQLPSRLKPPQSPRVHHEPYLLDRPPIRAYFHGTYFKVVYIIVLTAVPLFIIFALAVLLQMIVDGFSISFDIPAVSRETLMRNDLGKG